MPYHQAFSISRRGFLKVMGASALATFIGPTMSSCARVSGTGRRQLMLIPASQGIALGNEAWAEIRATERRTTTLRTRRSYSVLRLGCKRWCRKRVMALNLSCL